MDLVAGDLREILLVLSIDDLEAFDDRARFDAHLALGAGLDPTWLDTFSEAVRSGGLAADPTDFIDARSDLDGRGEVGDRYVERVDRVWVSAVAKVPDQRIGPIAARWIELLEEDLGELPREEKPWIRDLAGHLVTFCREADAARDVVFAWSL